MLNFDSPQSERSVRIERSDSFSSLLDQTLSNLSEEEPQFQRGISEVLDSLCDEYDAFMDSMAGKRWLVADVRSLQKFFGRAVKQAGLAIKAAESNKHRLDLATDLLGSQGRLIADHSEKLASIEELLKSQVIPALANVPTTGGTTSAQTSSQPVPVPAPRSRPSYTSILKSNPRIPLVSGERVIIRPKPNHTSSFTDTHSLVNRVAPSATHAKSLLRAIPSRNGQLVLSLGEEAEAAQLRQTLSNDPRFSANFDVLQPRKRNPRVLLSGVPKSMNDDDLLNLIHTRNPELLPVAGDFMALKQAVSIKLHLKNDSSQTMGVVLEAPPKLAAALVTLSNIRLEYLTVQCRYYVLVTRCYQCCGLGHRQKMRGSGGAPQLCTKPLACSQCSEAHKFKDCPYRPGRPLADATKTCCPVCTAENTRTGTSALNTAHNAFDDKCPTLVSYKKSEHDRTDYDGA